MRPEEAKEKGITIIKEYRRYAYLVPCSNCGESIKLYKYSEKIKHFAMNVDIGAHGKKIKKKFKMLLKKYGTRKNGNLKELKASLKGNGNIKKPLMIFIKYYIRINILIARRKF